MANQTIFKRYEYKYLLTADQKKDLQAYMETYMKRIHSDAIPSVTCILIRRIIF